MDDAAAGYLPAYSINDAVLADFPLCTKEREEDTRKVGPRRVINPVRFTSYSDMTRPVSLLPPGSGMDMEWRWIVLAQEAEPALPETVLGSQSYLVPDATKASG
jgi:hypothetical protein